MQEGRVAHPSTALHAECIDYPPSHGVAKTISLIPVSHGGDLCGIITTTTRRFTLRATALVVVILLHQASREA